jgi:methylase of polypeptide subunit release factors
MCQCGFKLFRKKDLGDMRIPSELVPRKDPFDLESAQGDEGTLDSTQGDESDPTVLQLTRQVWHFLIKHAPTIPEHQHWEKAKGIVRHQYALTPLAWACALTQRSIHGKTVQSSDLDWFFCNFDYAGAPLSRIIGYGCFFGRRFDLNEATLDPRWESEGIVDLVIEEYGAGYGSSGQGPRRILDVGTGSGCLLIQLLLHYPGAIGLGLDISTKALEAAMCNAQRHGVSDRAYWRPSDGLNYFCKKVFFHGLDGLDEVGEPDELGRLGEVNEILWEKHPEVCSAKSQKNLKNAHDAWGKISSNDPAVEQPNGVAPTAAVKNPDGQSIVADIGVLTHAFELGENHPATSNRQGLFDIIVSNPPYVPTAFPLPDDVKKWDPTLALDGGCDGLDAYRAWIGPMVQKLVPGGVLVLEMGWDQGDAVWDLCLGAGLVQGGIAKDLDGKNRYVWGRLKKEIV